MDERVVVIDTLKNYFAEQSDVELALLYGSFAEGKINEASDIDIAVHTKEEASLERLIDFRIEISALTHREIDILDLRKAEGIILCQVMKQGINVKKNNMLFAHYNLKAIYFHEDFLPAVRMMQDAKIRRFVNGS
jgi:predicted nucleotidyltransferase